MTIDRRPSVERPTLLVAFSGWSDAGASATTAVRFVAEQSGAEAFARIDGEEFFDFTVQRPMVRLEDQQVREIEWPGWDIRAAEGFGLLTLAGPEPHLRWRTYADAVARVAREAGVVRTILLGAYLADVPPADPVPLTGFSSEPGALERIGVAATAYQGPTGIVGVLADRFRRENVPVSSLWAAIPHALAATANPRGALALLLKLREWQALPLDLAPLESAAITFQSRILELLESGDESSGPRRPPRKTETSH